MQTAITDHLDPDPRKICLRKAQTILSITGMGIVFFGLWDSIKAILVLVLFQTELIDQMNTTAIPEPVYKAILYSISILAVLLAFLLRLYIGLSAAREARGIPQRKSAYIWLAGFLVLTAAFSSIYYLGQILQGTDLGTSLASILLEFTSMLTSLQLVITASIVRRSAQ